MCTNNRKWRTKLEAMGFERAVMSASRDFEVEIRDEVVHCVRGSRSIELACLKKKEEERKTFGPFCEFLVWYLCDAFSHH